jgi:hypothetical protein
MPNLVKKRVSVFDLGFEDAKKLRELAKKKQHAKKKFLGVEWVKREKLNTRFHNLKLTYGDALSKLKRMAPSSVNVITADFFFSEFKINGKEISDHSSLRKKLNDKYQKRKIDTLKEVKRVLLPNGRFFVIEYGLDLEKTVALLTQNGFVCTKKVVPQNQMHRTEFLSLIADRMIVDGRHAPDWQPYVITARKKVIA